VSQLHPGPVITISLEPTIAFNERSGMATSTRNHALELWGQKLPPGDPEKLAYILFCYDNPPGSNHISGSQDSIGIAMPGLNIAYYEGKYWPTKIEHVGDELTLQFVEQALYLMPLGPRGEDYNPLDERNLTAEGAKALADATLDCWQAILKHDLQGFGRSFRAAFDAQIAMFPHMVNENVFDLINRHKHEA